MLKQIKQFAKIYEIIIIIMQNQHNKTLALHDLFWVSSKSLKFHVFQRTTK